MTDNTSESTSSPSGRYENITLPFVECAPCQTAFSTENFPIMSKTCPHSICVDCLHKQINNKNNDKYFECPICREKDAFHTTHSKPNYIAVAALNLMEQATDLLVKQSKELIQIRSKQASSSSSKKTAINAIPAKRRVSLYNKNSPSNNNNSHKTTTKVSKKPPPSQVAAALKNRNKITSNSNRNDHHPNVVMNTPTPPNITVPETSEEEEESDGESTMMVVATKKKKMLAPPPPGSERMVWVKFQSRSQLAFLQSVDGDKATIRWESYKYTEVVDADRIEEMDDQTNASSRAKRRRRGSAAANSS